MDIHRLNGYFVALERKCAPACHCICKSTGYGLEREICSKCSKPIDYVEFDNETIPETTCEPWVLNYITANLSPITKLTINEPDSANKLLITNLGHEDRTPKEFLPHSPSLDIFSSF